MTTAATSLLGLALPVTGELSGTWGDTVNNSITSLLDTAIAGTTTLSTDGDVTLSTTTLAANQARQAILLCSGARTAIRTITAPAQSKIYTIINATTGGYAVKLVGAGPTTGLTIPNGASAVVAWNGSDFIEIGSSTIGNLTVNGNLTVTGTTTLSGGTANGVAYLNGSKAVTTGSALTFDGNQLGLTPTSGNAVTKLFGPTGSGVGAYFAVYAQGANSGYFGTDSGITGSGTSNDLTIYPAGTNNIRFYQGGSEAMRLTSTGLGIGTSSPTAKLQSLSGAVEPFRFRSSSAGWNYMAIGHVTSGDLGYIGDGASVITSGSNNDLGIQVKASGGLVVATGGSAAAKMTLDASGNLGLGVTPSAWGSGRITLELGGSTQGAIALNGNAANGGSIWTNSYNNGTSNLYKATGYATRFDTNNSGSFAWFTAPSGTAGNAITFTQAMTLDASGNLGIGATSSSGRVQINGANTTYDTNCIGQVLVRSTTAYNATPRAGIAFSVLYNSAGDYTSGGCSIQCYKENSTNGDFATGLLFTTQAYGGAPAERARIDSSGNLLVGSSTSDLAARAMIIGSSGFAVQYGGSTGTNLQIVPGAANGTVDFKFDARSGGYPAATFWTSNTEKMRLDSSGNLLVGLTSAGGRRLWVAGSNAGYISTIENDNAAPFGLQIYHPTDVNGTGNSFLVCVGNATNRVELRSNGGIGNYSANNVNLSDERLKKDFQAAPSYYDRWLQINFVTFLYKDQTDDERNLGVKAGQLESVCPELIDNSGFGKAPEGEAPYKAVYQTDFQYATAVALQEAIKKIEQLTERITALEGK